MLAACDPANPYGAALPWPEREGHRPGRKAGALVVLVGGALVFYVERGGKTLLSFTEDPARLDSRGGSARPGGAAGTAGQADGRAGRRRARLRLGSVSEALQEAGFRMTPQGLRLRPNALVPTSQGQ